MNANTWMHNCSEPEASYEVFKDRIQGKSYLSHMINSSEVSLIEVELILRCQEGYLNFIQQLLKG